MATESNPADMLTKALGRSKVEEFCAEIGRTEPHAKTLANKPKKLKEVKFAIETMEANDGAVENKFEGFKNFIDHARGCRIAMDAPLWEEFSETVSVNDAPLWNQKRSLNLRMWSWKSASEGSKSRANGVATSTSLVGRVS